MKSSILKYYVSASNTLRNRLFNNEQGAALIEYALILSLISIVAIAAMSPLGAKIAETFNNIVAQLP